MKLSPQELAKIADVTLSHYNQRAEDFWRGTRDHDVSQNIAALLQYIEGAPPFTLLDFGCGPGRDLKALAARGHVAIGLEGAARRDGARLQRMRRVAAGFPRARFAGRPVRWRVRQRVPVPRAEPHTVGCPEAIACLPETARRAVRLEPARPQRGGMEWRALRRLPRSRKLAALPVRRRIRRAHPFLPP